MTAIARLRTSLTKSFPRLARVTSIYKLFIHRVYLFLFLYIHKLLLPPPKEGGYVFTCVCLSVCLPLNYSESYEGILMNFWSGCIDPDCDQNTGVFKGFFINYYCDYFTLRCQEQNIKIDGGGLIVF